MKYIVVLLLVALAAYQTHPEWFSWLNEPSVVAGDREVVVFSFNACGQYCDNAMDLLREKNIEFTHFNVQAGEEQKKLWEDMGGGDIYPVIHIGRQKLQGYDRNRITHALAKNFGMSLLDAGMRSVVQQQLTAYGETTAVMYGTSWCPQCAKAREFFKENNMPYVEFDVEKSRQDMRNYAALNASGYPLIYVGMHRFEGFGPQVKEQLKRLL